LHIVVIGGGVVGLNCAWHARRAGHHVTVLERGTGDDGCSHGNAGIIVPSHFVPLAAPGMVALGLKWMWQPDSPFYIQPRLDLDLWRWAWRFWRSATARHVARAAPVLRDLHLASRALYEELAEELGDAFALERRGLLMLCNTAHGLDEEARLAQQARSLGLAAEVLEPAAAAALEPGITMAIAGAVYYAHDCHLVPHALMTALQSELARREVMLKYGAQVAGWDLGSQGIRAVRTSDGQGHRGDVYVVCAGAWSSGLTGPLGLRLPLQAGKGYSLTLPRPRQLPRICSILTEARVAVTPIQGALRFGGTMEFSGPNEIIRPRRVQGIVNAAVRYFPEFQPGDFEDVRPWCGLRPCSPDGLPYLGRLTKHPQVIVATGHAMLGVSLGAITGQIVARLIDGANPGHDLELLRPERFG
jgi:D-amino-acid dehydrogenase